MTLLRSSTWPRNRVSAFRLASIAERFACLSDATASILATHCGSGCEYGSKLFISGGKFGHAFTDRQRSKRTTSQHEALTFSSVLNTRHDCASFLLDPPMICPMRFGANDWSSLIFSASAFGIASPSSRLNKASAPCSLVGGCKRSPAFIASCATPTLVVPNTFFDADAATANASQSSCSSNSEAFKSPGLCESALVLMER